MSSVHVWKVAPAGATFQTWTEDMRPPQSHHPCDKGCIGEWRQAGLRARERYPTGQAAFPRLRAVAVSPAS